MNFILPRVLAHRGASQLAPENTLSAFRLAAQHHAGWIELDVMLSRDYVPIIFHDDHLERVSDGQGLVANHHLLELKALTVKAETVTSVTSDTIPTLVEFLTFLSTTNLGVNLEIKPNQLGALPTCQQMLTVLQHMGCDAASWQNRLMVSSFNRDVILFFRQHAPWLPRSYLIDAFAYQYDSVSFARQHDCVCVSFWHEMPMAQDLLHAAHAMGMPTLCYAVDQLSEARQWLQRGVQGIFTNNVACYALSN